MTQPVPSSRNDWPLDFVGPPPPPELPLQPAMRGVIELPDPSTRSEGQGLVRLAPRPAIGSVPSDWERSAIGARLDAFLLRATPTFRTPEGLIAVPIAFTMNAPNATPFRSSLVARLARAAGLTDFQTQMLQQGRASPETIATGTQALIDAGHLPATDDSGGTDLAGRVRLLMREYGIGLDCVGYVAPAILAARGISRAQAGFGPPGSEDLSTLATHGYVRIPNESVLHPGDVFVLHPKPPSEGDPHPVGHRAIVREAGPASAAEIDALKRQWPSLPGASKTSSRWVKVVVDSSFGSHNNPGYGGAQRNVWWHDQTADVWAWDRNGERVVTPGPYDHARYEIMRLAGSP